MDRCRRCRCRCCRCCCCSKLFISCLSLSRLSVVVVIIIIIASAVNHLQMTSSLPVSKSLRIETTSGVGRSSYETRTKDRPGRYVSPHYQTVVSSLEAVGVLSDANESTTCFVLENLTKTWRPGIDGVSMVEVSLQVRQFQVPVGVRGMERGERRSKWSSDDNKAAAVHETDNACLEWLIRTTTIITSTPTTTTTTTTTTKVGGDDERRKGDLQEEDETSSASLGSGSGSGSGGSAQSGRNKSNVVDEEPKAKEKPKHEEHTGLNKRQILVISTCSTVIGAFFVTAFILRIRNYMKRSKQDKDGMKRHNIRAASMPPPHQRTHHGSLDHFANNENHRRWSHFNPFATDR